MFTAELRDAQRHAGFVLHGVREFQKIANHVESGVTGVYDRHSYDSEKKDALDKWAAKLMRIVSELKAVGKS